VAAGLLLVAGAGSWVGYQNREALMTLAGVTAKPNAPAPEVVASETAASAKAPVGTAAVSSSQSEGALDARFQKRAVWAAVKLEFPEWYEERLKETAKLEAEGKTELEITQHLVDALVALRRQNADKALAAGAQRHRELATAFRDNLKKLSEDGAETCYNFISKGESSPAAVALMQNAEKSGPIETQVLAIVSAISEGRKSPATHQSPVKADYDVLATELGRLGWTQADMQLFADPKALARAPHERVCKMVQDWFTAHLSIQDAGTQERLLFETLRPVVAG
jgi:hypothetical protein